MRVKKVYCRGDQKVNCPKGKKGHPGVLVVRRFCQSKICRRKAKEAVGFLLYNPKNCVFSADEQCSPLQSKSQKEVYRQSEIRPFGRIF